MQTESITSALAGLRKLLRTPVNAATLETLAETQVLQGKSIQQTLDLMERGMDSTDAMLKMIRNLNERVLVLEKAASKPRPKSKRKSQRSRK